LKPNGIALREDEFVSEALSADCAMLFRAGVLLESRRTPYQLIEVYATPQWGKLLRLDGCNMTSERDEFIYHENLIHPAALSHPAPRQVLVIGGGDGGAAEELLKHPSIEQVTLVELDEAVMEIAIKHFETVHRGVFDNPKLRIHIGDGFAFVRDTAQSFDLVVLDLTDQSGPAAGLYTPAMFAACHRVLNLGGLLSLHVGSPYFHPQRFRHNLGDLAGVFAVVRPYLAYVPTYGAPWGFATASVTVDPATMAAGDFDAAIVARRLPDLQYVNGATLQTGFVLPNFVGTLLR
jgi:spermidine synthase